MTEQTLTSIRMEFKSKVDELDDIPDMINNAYDKLKIISLASYWFYSDKRDEIQEKLKEVIAEIKKAVEGMFAPWLFVDYASKWQQVGAAVSKVYGIQNRESNNLEGNWDGDAYKSFKDSRGFQATAMNTIQELCEKIHTQLLIIAEEGRNFYKSAIDNLATIISDAGTFAGEAATTAGASVPFTVGTLNNAITATVELTVQAITDFAEVQTKVWIASNELENMIKSPKGLAVNDAGNDAWPGPNTIEYDNKEDGWKWNS
ncbi:hypothetical protein ACFXK0_26255 [Nocardia sp. NPDC059177]|uniref:hypothetical protein n=1 Tax=Nocardia sp. NPDC059177 TaxID=3346759 RepID=UPI00367A7E23